MHVGFPSNRFRAEHVRRSRRSWRPGWIGRVCLLAGSLAIIGVVDETAADDNKTSPAAAVRGGDRVVLLGATFVERAQRYGYLETAIVRRFPQDPPIVRNLGWSGDTVWAESRGIFDPPAEGYRRMLERVTGLKPTVILLAYGTNESFAGPAGLKPFISQLRQLTNDLAKTGARIVYVSPHLNLSPGQPLPSAEARNEQIRLYANAMRRLAADQELTFVDIQELLTAAPQPAELTDNGVHLNEAGWRYAGEAFARRLFSEGSPDRSEWTLALDASGEIDKVHGLTILQKPNRQGDVWNWHLLDDRLPAPSASNRRLTIKNLPPGRYRLTIGEQDIAEPTAAALAAGILIDRGPAFVQAEKLRQTVIRKNERYFHSWRPQNITYLFGFRKHEQGQNAKEVEQFAGLVEESEQQLRSLVTPQPNIYRLQQIAKKDTE